MFDSTSITAIVGLGLTVLSSVLGKYWIAAKAKTAALTQLINDIAVAEKDPMVSQATVDKIIADAKAFMNA